METNNKEIIEIYKSFWTNILNFKGRATRKEFWITYLINFVISFGINMFTQLALFCNEYLGYIMTIIPTLFSLAIFIPTMSISIRRLHDSGKSCLSYIISMIVNFICGIVAILLFIGLIILALGSTYNSNISNFWFWLILIVIILCCLTSLIFSILMIIFYCLPSASDNKYGPSKKVEQNYNQQYYRQQEINTNNTISDKTPK